MTEGHSLVFDERFQT